MRPLPEPPAVEDAARDHHVVAGAVAQLAERGLEHPVAFHDEDDLVALRVAVEDGVFLARPDERERDVGVEQQRHAVAHGARPGREPRGPEVPVPHHALGLGRPLERGQRPHALDGRGQPQVVEQRRRPGEALVADQLLVVDPAALLAEGDVALLGYAPQLVVDGHSALRLRGAHSIPRGGRADCQSGEGLTSAGRPSRSRPGSASGRAPRRCPAGRPRSRRSRG